MASRKNISPRTQAQGTEAVGGNGTTGGAFANGAGVGKVRRKRPLWRRVLRGISRMVGVLAALVLIVVLLLQTRWGANTAGDLVLRFVNPIGEVTVSVGTFTGNWVSRLELHEITLLRHGTEQMAQVDTIEARYALLPLLGLKLHVKEARAVNPVVTIRQEADSTWDVVKAFVGEPADEELPEDTTSGSGFTVQVDRIQLANGAGSVHFYAPDRDSTLTFKQLHVDLLDLVVGETLGFNVDHLALQTLLPDSEDPFFLTAQGDLTDQRFTLQLLEVESASSTMRAEGEVVLPSADDEEIRDINVSFFAEPLAFRDVAAFAPTLDPDAEVAVDLTVTGAMSQLTANGEARFSDGGTLNLQAEATPAIEGDLVYQVEGEVRRLNPGLFLVSEEEAVPAQFNADVKVDLQGPALDSLNGIAQARLFASHYGEYAPDETTLEATFTNGRARLDLQSGLRGMGLSLGGQVHPFAEAPTYNLQGQVDHFDLSQFVEDSTGTQRSDVNTTFQVRGTGFDPAQADVTAAIQVLASQFNQNAIEEGVLNARLMGGGLTFDTDVVFDKGRVAAKGEAFLGSDLRYRIYDGSFEDLDVMALAGDTTHSQFNGAFGLTGRGTDSASLHLEEIALTLTPSTYDIYVVESAQVRGALQNQQLDAVAEAKLQGGEVALEAMARPFDAVPTYALTEGTFNNLDIGALLLNPEQTSDLNGRIAVTGQGFDPEMMVVEAHLTLDNSQLNTQTINAAQLDATLQQGALALNARLDTPEGTTSLQANGEPLATVPRFSIQESSFNGLNIGALLGLSQADTDLNGTLKLDLQGFDPETMDLEVALDLAGSRVNEEGVVNGQTLVSLTGGAIEAEGQINFEQGLARFEASAHPFEEALTYQLEGVFEDVRVARLAGIDTLTTEVSARVDVEGAGMDPATMDLQGHLQISEILLDEVLVDSVEATFRLAEGAIQIDTLLVQSNVLEATAGGHLALFDTLGAYNSDLAFQANVLDAMPLRSFIDAHVFSMGQAFVSGRIHGQSDTLKLETEAQIHNLVYDEIHMLSFEGKASGVFGKGWDLDVGEADVVVDYFSIPAIAVEDASAKLSFDQDIMDYTLNVKVDERRSGFATGLVNLRPDSQEVVIDDMNLRLAGGDWQLLQEASVSFGDEYRVNNLLLYADDQQIAVDGVVNLEGEQSLILTIEEFEISTVADLLGYQGMGGRLNGALDLTGPADAPRIIGSLFLDAESRDQDVGNLGVEIQYDSLQLNMDARLVHVDQSAFSLTGYVPIDLRLSQPAEEGVRPVQVSRQRADSDGGVALRLEADRFNVGWVEPFLDQETFGDVDGYLTAQVDIGGTLSTPILDGTIQLTDGNLHLSELGTTFKNGQIAADLSNNQVVFNQAYLESGEGQLTATGTVDMAELTLGEFHLDVDATNFQMMRTSEAKLAASLDLTVSGTTTAPVLKGDVEVVSAEFRPGTESANTNLGPVQFTEQDLRMLERNFGIRVSIEDTTTFDIFDALAMDLAIKIGRNSWLRKRINPEMNIQFFGDLDLRKEPAGDILLFGGVEVYTERSWVREFGRRFDIDRGNINFNGPMTEPQLDLEAKYQVRSRRDGNSEIEILLIVRGTLDNMELDLQSDPPTDQSNILSYIATGRPSNEAFQQGAGTAQEIAFNQIAGLVQSAAGSAIGLDVIEITQEGGKGAKVTAGHYFGSKFYGAVSWPLSFSSSSSSSNNTTDTSKQEVTLEYEIIRSLLVRVVGGSEDIEVKLLYEYAY